MIELGGLPPRVADEVRLLEAELTMPASVRAAHLRGRAGLMVNVACTEFNICAWVRVEELLGLSIGYLVAAARVETEPTT